jgi:hypothetical protein
MNYGVNRWYDGISRCILERKTPRELNEQTLKITKVFWAELRPELLPLEWPNTE